MKTTQDPHEVHEFESGAVDPTTFDHLAHVRAAVAMLRTYAFLDATARYATTIEGMAQRVGAHDKFHVTITVAFMALIAERMGDRSWKNFEHFIEENPDLRSSDALASFYSPERLGSSVARRTFILPDRGTATGPTR